MLRYIYLLVGNQRGGHHKGVQKRTPQKCCKMGCWQNFKVKKLVTLDRSETEEHFILNYVTTLSINNLYLMSFNLLIMSPDDLKK